MNNDQIEKLLWSIALPTFTQFLNPAPNSWDSPRVSAIPTFSDKLMMIHVAGLISAGISYYGASLGSSPRKDLGVDYSRLILETSQYAEDGTNIMIKHGWLEKPPQAPDRNQLARKK
ncbi:DUF3231 family protein [Alkalihalobacterium alkalinitrilicum]|uniref:DUF3231 family protein n=1 Tax=Alkalihalobacterium alkalinitrilicum TaxID=427920 RepID=UPI000994EB8B|nr:DUF3231 family protein [Alkalihalobacterium alkalinitrilicum]